MIVADANAIAKELSQWFHSVLRLVDTTWFGVAAPGPHRDAVVLDTLRRNARILTGSRVDTTESLYLPLCFYLAAACSHLDVQLGPGHWRAAIDNVRELRRSLREAHSQSAGVGLDFGTSASFFKAELEETLRQSGLTEGVTYLSREDQKVALGLSINWALRLLLAYAIENRAPDRAATPGARDLTWLAALIRPAVE